MFRSVVPASAMAQEPTLVIIAAAREGQRLLAFLLFRLHHLYFAGHHKKRTRHNLNEHRKQWPPTGARRLCTLWPDRVSGISSENDVGDVLFGAALHRSLPFRCDVTRALHAHLLLLLADLQFNPVWLLRLF